jgi:hypothetical protein
MISSIEINERWSKISPSSNRYGFRLLRISSKCIPELSIGLDHQSKRCLVLSLDPAVQLGVTGIHRNNISLEHIPGSELQYLVIKLIDDFFEDLFDDLIVSIYNCVSQLEDELIQSKEFRTSFLKWSEFFIKGNNSRLSKDEVQGLIGELKMLEELLTDADQVDEMLSGWRGPYDESKDFILNDKDIEVKTIQNGRDSIQISSEYQLEAGGEKIFEVVLYKVKIDPRGGVSLRQQVDKVKALVFQGMGNFSIVLDALRQKNLGSGNLSDYDNFRYTFRSRIIYDADASEFPKLTSVNIPNEIFALKYSLKLSQINDFIENSYEYEDKSN